MAVGVRCAQLDLQIFTVRGAEIMQSRVNRGLDRAVVAVSREEILRQFA